MINPWIIYLIFGNKKATYTSFFTVISWHHLYDLSLVLCHAMYIVTFCLTDTDECMDGSHNCVANSTCYNTPGSYICVCDDAFEGDGAVSCTCECPFSIHLSHIQSINAPCDVGTFIMKLYRNKTASLRAFHNNNEFSLLHLLYNSSSHLILK